MSFCCVLRKDILQGSLKSQVCILLKVSVPLYWSVCFGSMQTQDVRMYVSSTTFPCSKFDLLWMIVIDSIYSHSDSMAIQLWRHAVQHCIHCLLLSYCLYTTITVVHLSLQIWFIDAQSHLGKGFAIVLDGVMSSVAPGIADNLRLACGWNGKIDIVSQRLGLPCGCCTQQLCLPAVLSALISWARVNCYVAGRSFESSCAASTFDNKSQIDARASAWTSGRHLDLDHNGTLGIKRLSMHLTKPRMPADYIILPRIQAHCQDLQIST